MEIKDLEGNVVVPGDRVAGAFRIGNTAVLRTGLVLGFGERGNKITVQVRWSTGSDYGQNGALNIVGAIEADKLRFVKIGA
jgi:hypothetical protein